MNDLWKRRLVGLVAVTVALSALTWIAYGNLGNNLVYYWSPTELVEHGADANGATVRLGGLVVPGSFDLEACKPGCSFRVTDGKNEVNVSTEGLPPQMFREGIGVVVEGSLQGGTFHTDRVMIKHSNEYKAPTDGDISSAAQTLSEDPS